jgi:hypothetical protein
LILQWRGRLSNALQKSGKIEFKAIQSTFSHPTQQRRLSKPSVRTTKSFSATSHAYSLPSAQNFSTSLCNHSSMDTNPIRRPDKSLRLSHSHHDESSKSSMINCNPASVYPSLTSMSQRITGAYVENNQHQTLSRKSSIHPCGETNQDKSPLCQTLSAPNPMGFYNMMSMNSTPNNYRMMFTPYSTRSFQSSSSSSSPPLPPMPNSHAEHGRTDYFGKIRDHDFIFSRHNSLCLLR